MSNLFWNCLNRGPTCKNYREVLACSEVQNITPLFWLGPSSPSLRNNHAQPSREIPAPCKPKPTLSSNDVVLFLVSFIEKIEWVIGHLKAFFVEQREAKNRADFVLFALSGQFILQQGWLSSNLCEAGNSLLTCQYSAEATKSVQTIYKSTTDQTQLRPRLNKRRRWSRQFQSRLHLALP